MNTHIIDFIKKQKTASICCVDSNSHPYCFSCYYVFDEAEHLLVFKSSKDSHHVQMFTKDMVIAGTILPDRQEVLSIKGVQFTGILLDADDILCIEVSKSYYKKIPFALAMPGDIYTIRLDKIKMTDNSLGIGKKINWDRGGEHKLPSYQQSFL